MIWFFSLSYCVSCSLCAIYFASYCCKRSQFSFFFSSSDFSSYSYYPSLASLSCSADSADSSCFYCIRMLLWTKSSYARLILIRRLENLLPSWSITSWKVFDAAEFMRKGVALVCCIWAVCIVASFCSRSVRSMVRGPWEISFLPSSMVVCADSVTVGFSKVCCCCCSW